MCRTDRRRPTLRISWRTLLVAGALVSPVTPASLPAQLPKAAVRRLDSLLQRPPFDRLLWGIALVDEKGRLLYGRNADKLFIPASNTKLVVSAVASALLPPDWTVTTGVYAAGPVSDGVVHGDLILYGRGDPTFGRRCYATDTTRAGVCDQDPFTRLRELADTLRARGIRSVEGELVGDGSWFDGELVHPDWGNYDLNWWYAAPVAGLGFNDNSVDITWKPGPQVGAPTLLTLDPNLGDVFLENRSRTVEPGGDTDIGDRMYRVPGTLQIWAEGTVALDSRGGLESFALPDPNLFAARAFRRALAEAGISVLGTTASTTDSLRYRTAREAGPLAETRSRPLSDWIFPILNTSQNWYADMLVKQLGRQFGTSGSWSEGIAVERRYLIDSMGIDSTLFALSDGSGLSAANLVAPLAFTRLLQVIRKHPHYARNFEPGLPLSGRVGSLKNRFLGTPIEGRVRAKTGSISRVNTLSGYLEMPDGHTYAFSIQANHHAQGGRKMLAQIDSVVVAMAKALAKRR
jgi:serine-type D-Ala-D-Ala carboxypeptidase/endopeptidase (penicillin-binding protein 4)